MEIRALYPICLVILVACSTPSTQFGSGSDITSSLQRSIDHGSAGDTIRLPKGTFYLSKAVRFYQKRNIHLIGEQTQLIMKAGTNVDDNGGMLEIIRSEGITLSKILFDGNRDNRASKEVNAHTIRIVNSYRIDLIEVEVRNSVVDGFYIASYQPAVLSEIPRAVNLINCVAKNSFRNGLSIINGYDILVEGGSFSYSSGTAPAAGIDIESNDDDLPHPGSQNIRINRVKCINNEGWGMLISQKGTPRDIIIQHSDFQNCGGGIKAAGVRTTIDDNSIQDCDIGIESVRYAGRERDENIISHNSIDQCPKGIRYCGNAGMISDNVISNAKEFGIHLNGNTLDATMVTLRRNTITDCESDGIQSNNFDQVVIDSNQISEVGRYGLYLINGTQVVRNNRVNQSATAIYSLGSTTEVISNEINQFAQKAILFRPSSKGQSIGQVSQNTIKSSRRSADAIDVGNGKVILGRNNMQD